MKNKIYRIRDKRNNTFVNLGYNQKHTWLVYPYEAIRLNKHVLHNMENYEVVVYEYKEVETLPLLENKKK